MLDSQMFPCYKLFPAEISLCSVSSSAPPRMMSKCGPRAGTESGRSLQAAGATRRRAGVGVTRTFQPPALLVLQRPCERAHGLLFALCWGHRCSFPDPNPALVTACQTALHCLPAVLSGCLQSNQDQAVHEGCTASGNWLQAPQEAASACQGDRSIVCGKRKVLSLSSPLPCFPQPQAQRKGEDGRRQCNSPTTHTHEMAAVRNHLPSSSSSSSPDSQRCSREDEQARSQQGSPGALGRSEAMN